MTMIRTNIMTTMMVITVGQPQQPQQQATQPQQPQQQVTINLNVPTVPYFLQDKRLPFGCSNI
jgi:hypothetical protein